MEKLMTVLESQGVFGLFNPAAWTAGGHIGAASVWLCLPFAGLLLCIAVLPLVKAEWWEAHQPHAVVFWSLLFLFPFAALKGVGTAAETVLECIVNDYLTFIVLLFGLFCVSGLSENQCGASGPGDASFDPDRDNGRQYAHDPSDY